jgi:hypothetical protein
MTKKSKKLINERVIRRWGKLANMQPLTETFIDSLSEEDELEDELGAAEDEVAAGEAELDAGEEAEASVEETEAVERIVSAVVDAISVETGVAIEVEGEAGDEGAMDAMDAGMGAPDELDADAEMDIGDEAANRRPYNRKDLEELSNKKGGQGYDAEEDESLGMKDGKESTKKQSDKDRRDDSRGKFGKRDETLNLDVLDDEALTEAVLKRVVERLLRRK